MCKKHCTWTLDRSTLQRPVLHLEVSTPQGPELHLDVSGQQEPLLLLDLYSLQGLNCTWTHLTAISRLQKTALHLDISRLQ
jgi:hypothetical protein